MEINTKSKFRKAEAAISTEEIESLLNVVKESAQAVAEAVKDQELTPQDGKTTLAQKAPVVAAVASRKFYAIEKNKTTQKYDVVEAIEGPNGIQRTQVVESHINLAVAIAKLSETISRLCLIKKEF